MPPQRRNPGQFGPPRRRPKIAGSTRARSYDASNDRPIDEGAAAENPAAENPAAETPAVETPGVEAPAAETPVADSSAGDGPAREAPVVEKSASESPVAEPSDTGAVSTVEPGARAAATSGDAASDDATPDDGKTDDAKTDDAKTDGVTPLARVSGTASAAKPAHRNRSMRSVLAIGVVALVLAAVAVVAAFRPGTSVSNEAWVDAAATREVTDAAKHAIEAMHGYNYETIDEDFAEIRGLLTQERLEEFDATAEVTKQAAIQTRTVTEVNVLHIGTSVLDETQAEVAAYINVSATGDGIAQGSAQAPVLVRMEKTDGQWLVSEIRDR
ncbi:hypothetical protein TVH25_15135 [Rhodococcus sp. 7Tela_A2]|uniref:hypothetical protein n=1 Tax=Rhodococcus sp. 7Tela_A2 TaxID=3093744 RepID=UPI003BB612D9